MKVYDVIKTAEDTYINETSHLSYPGMCWCLKVAATKGMDFKDKNRKGHPSYKDLVTNIPEPANDAVMKDKPRSPKAFIITKQMWYEIFGVGIIFFIFLVTLLYTKAVSLTEFFTIFVLLQWWNLFNARVFGQRRSIFDGLLKNPAFAGIALVILVGQFLIVQYGGAMFRTEPLSMETWVLILAGTSIVTVVRELFYQISKIFK